MDTVIITIIILGIIIFALNRSVKKSRKITAEGINELEGELNVQLENIANKRIYYQPHSKTFFGVAIDDDNKNFCLMESKNGVPLAFHGKYDDVLSVEFIDGNTVDKVAKENSIGRAALGGLVFGGVGAIVGASSAKSVNEGKKLVQINLVIDNPRNPNYSLTFLDYAYTKSDKGFADIFYEDAIKEAREWNALLTYIIKHSEKTNKEKALNSSAQQIKNSISDELQKLADLRAKGIIDDVEFRQLKSKLLSENLYDS